MIQDELVGTFPIALYLDILISEYFTLKTWEMVERNSIIIQCIPLKINETYWSMNLGAFHKFIPKLKYLIVTR